jgi:hypothetical protein
MTTFSEIAKIVTRASETGLIVLRPAVEPHAPDRNARRPEQGSPCQARRGTLWL